MKNWIGKSLLIAASIAAIAYGAAGSRPSSNTEKETPRQSSKVVAIRDVRIFDGERTIPKGNVVIENGLIRAVGADAKIPSGAAIIEGNGRTVLPGLIDSHTHAYGDALERALQFGVTTELDMFTNVAQYRTWKKEQKDGVVTNRADIVSAGTLVTIARGHGTEYFPIPTISGPTEADVFVRARIEEGSDFIKIVYEDGKSIGYDFPSISRETLEAVIEATHAQKRKAVVHIGTMNEARDAIEAGADGLVHVFRGTVPDQAFLDLARRHSVFITPTMTVIESLSGRASGASLAEDSRLQPFLTTEEKASLRRSFPLPKKVTWSFSDTSRAVKLLFEAGVPILAGSDAPNAGTSHGASMHRELELLVEAGLTPEQALRSATSVPARHFGLSDRGKITAGRRADLILVEGDPTQSIQATRAIVSIWKAGVPVERIKPSNAAVAAVDPGTGVVSSFDDGTMKSEFGFGWHPSDDKRAGGSSTVSIDVVESGASGSSHALRVRGVVGESAYPWAGAMFFAGKTMMQPVDLSSRKTISFYVRGEKGRGQAMVFAASLGRVPAVELFEIGPAWQKVSLPIQTFQNIDGKDIQALLISGGPERGAFEFAIDEVKFE